MKRKKDITTPAPAVGAQTTGNDWSAVTGAIPVSVPIPVDLVDPNPEQPRFHFDETALKELADNIQRRGLIQPIVVQPNGDRFTLHDGERRWRAHKLAGLTEVPAYIVPPGADPKELLLRAIAANDQRADLSPIERAKSYQRLHDDYGLSDAAIAEEVGKSRSVVANLRRLLQLPDDRQQQVASGELSERQALALLPFYQLHPQIQEALGNTWHMRDILQNPGEVTSGKLRSQIRDGLQYITTHFSTFDPAAQLGGGGVRHSLCADCPFFIKVGDEARCADKACRDAKEASYFLNLLEEAKVLTGLNHVQPSRTLTHNQKTEFYSWNKPILEYALAHGCRNLILYADRHSTSAARPDGVSEYVHYICLHPGKSEKSCTCRQAVESDKVSAEKLRKVQVQRVKDQAIAALLPELEACGLTALKLMAPFVVEYSEKKKIDPATSPAKLARMVANHMVNRELWVTNDPDRAAQMRQDWFTKIGLTIDSPPHLSDLDRRLARLEGWLTDHEERPPAEQVKAIRGNLTNLARVGEELGQVSGATEDELSSFTARFDLTKRTLLTWLEQVEALAAAATMDRIEARLDAPQKSVSETLDEIGARLDVLVPRESDPLHNEMICGKVEERGENHTGMDHEHSYQNGTGVSLGELFEVEEKLLQVEDWLVDHGPTASEDELRRHCFELDRLGGTIGRYEAKWHAIPLSRGLAERINSAGELAEELIERLLPQPEVAA